MPRCPFRWIGRKGDARYLKVRHRLVSIKMKEGPVPQVPGDREPWQEQHPCMVRGHHVHKNAEGVVTEDRPRGDWRDVLVLGGGEGEAVRRLITTPDPPVLATALSRGRRSFPAPVLGDLPFGIVLQGGSPLLGPTNMGLPDYAEYRRRREDCRSHKRRPACAIGRP